MKKVAWIVGLIVLLFVVLIAYLLFSSEVQTSEIIKGKTIEELSELSLSVECGTLGLYEKKEAAAKNAAWHTTGGHFSYPEKIYIKDGRVRADIMNVYFEDTQEKAIIKEEASLKIYDGANTYIKSVEGKTSIVEEKLSTLSMQVPVDNLNCYENPSLDDSLFNAVL